MAPLYKIQFISRTDCFNPYERIRSVGGLNPNGSRWMISHREAVEAVAHGKLEFYVENGQRPVRVVVAEAEGGRRYLKTEVDDAQPNNLLLLPECR